MVYARRMVKRTATEQKAWEDFDVLLQTYLAATRKVLQKDKFVIPMAVILDADGVPTFQALQPADDQTEADIAAHLEAYRALLQHIPVNTTACMLGYDVRIQQPSYQDAIAVELEHANGTLQKLIIPYRFKGWLRKRLELAPPQPIESEGKHLLRRA